MKKKSGITIVETLITITLILVVFSLIYPVFLNANKSFIKIDLKADIQQDSSLIESEFTKLLAQARGIDEISVLDSNGYEFKIDKDKNLDNYLDENNVFAIENIYKISFSIEDENREVYDYIIENKYIKTIKDKKIYKLSIGKKKQYEDISLMKYKILSENVSNLKIKLTENTLEKAEYINIIIDLYKKKGQTEINNNINSIITFRNKI